MMIHDTACPPNIMGTQPMSRMTRPTTTKQQMARPQKSKPSPQSKGVDPNDLSRRLYAVLAEQKAYAEKKRRAKANAEPNRRVLAVGTGTATDVQAGGVKGSSTHARRKDERPTQATSRPRPNDGHGHRRFNDEKLSTETPQTNSTDGYRHIPQVAASQFARTTKTEDAAEKHLVHRLSRPAMKFHLDGPNGSREMADITPGTSPIEQSKALRRAQSLREKLYDRNQFQHPAALQATMEADEQFGSGPQCRSFDGQRRPKWVDNDETISKRMSTGAMLGGWDADWRFSGGFDGTSLADVPEGGAHYELTAHPNDHRVDWTQSDETVPRQTANQTTPRKQESKWNLRGRMAGLNRHGKDEKPGAQPLEKTASDDSVKSSKSGFFARFKR
jgi:hypothetical protein